MMTEPLIKVGIITDGMPDTRTTPDGIAVSNLLIGDGFHWQKRLNVTLRGEVIPLSVPQGNIHAINRLPVEQYLESVIGSEMNPDAPVEFLKAHAIISRGWALRKITGESGVLSSGKIHESGRIVTWEESDTHEGFDVCSDDHCQRYQGIPANSSAATSAAVSATRGLVLTASHGKIADTRFSKCCGGRTEEFGTCWAEGDYPYLPSQSDPWCDLSDMAEEKRDKFLSTILRDYDRTTSDFREWIEEVSAGEIAERLSAKYGRDIGIILHLSPITRGKSGRITELCLEGTLGNVTIGKTLPIRRLLAADCLKSSWFDMEKREGVFILHGHGWGHGVGLCQIGAARMAAEGYDFRKILEFYYPGTKLTRLYE